MTALPQSKHEPLARAVAELVGDEPYEVQLSLGGLHTRIRLRYAGRPQGSMFVSEYLSDLNVAGLVRDAIDAIPKRGDKAGHALDAAVCQFETEAWHDCPQALWDIMASAGRVG